MWALHVSRIIYILHVLFATRMHGVSICIPLFCYAFMLRPWVYCVSRQNEHCSLLWATCTGAGGWQSDGKYKCQHPLLLRLRVCCFARWSCCFSVAHTSTINCISNMPFEFNMSPRIIILVSVCVMYTRVRRLPPPPHLHPHPLVHPHITTRSRTLKEIACLHSRVPMGWMWVIDLPWDHINEWIC